MTKQLKTLFYGLVILIAILAASTTFFAAKSRKVTDQTPVAKLSVPEGAVFETETTPTPQASTTASQPATEKPSSPAKTYTIQSHDTLFGIAQNEGVTLAELAETNGIDDTDKIQAGQVLVIPENNQVEFLVNNTKATEIQGLVDQGKNEWRLDPVETARSDIPTVYGLKTTDTYTLKEKDDEGGKATVGASSENGNFTINLIQPVTKGSEGIWAVESVKKV